MLQYTGVSRIRTNNSLNCAFIYKLCVIVKNRPDDGIKNTETRRL